MESNVNELTEVRKIWNKPDIVSLNSKETLGGLSSAHVEDDDYLDLDPSLG